MATAQLIDLSNYDTMLVQSTQSRGGTPDGNVYFNTTSGTIEFITKQELSLKLSMPSRTKSVGLMRTFVNMTAGLLVRLSSAALITLSTAASRAPQQTVKLSVALAGMSMQVTVG